MEIVRDDRVDILSNDFTKDGTSSGSISSPCPSSTTRSEAGITIELTIGPSDTYTVSQHGDRKRNISEYRCSSSERNGSPSAANNKINDRNDLDHRNMEENSDGKPMNPVVIDLTSSSDESVCCDSEDELRTHCTCNTSKDTHPNTCSRKHKQKNKSLLAKAKRFLQSPIFKTSDNISKIEDKSDASSLCNCKNVSKNRTDGQKIPSRSRTKTTEIFTPGPFEDFIQNEATGATGQHSLDSIGVYSPMDSDIVDSEDEYDIISIIDHNTEKETKFAIRSVRKTSGELSKQDIFFKRKCCNVSDASLFSSLINSPRCETSASTKTSENDFEPDNNVKFDSARTDLVLTKPEENSLSLSPSQQPMGLLQNGLLSLVVGPGRAFFSLFF